ncbi:MAG: PP0621 family protein [Pyrinomonadaceae bacterium]
MRETLFILFVILVLLGLTAIRYRKTIAGLLGVAKMLKEAKNAATGNTIGGEPASVQLVNCAKCGVWVPQAKAIRQREGVFYCSTNCQKTAV